MREAFEIRYVSIYWENREKANRISESEKIPVEKINGNQYRVETTAFNNHGQVAICILDPALDAVPYVESANFKKLELRPVKNIETGKIWWVESEKWDKRESRWQSEFFRSPGELNLYVGKNKIVIHNSSSSFTYEQLDRYLQDFKLDLWYLIINESSYIQAAAKQTQQKNLDVSSVELIKEFITFADKILSTPKKELRESQSLLPANKNRPIPKTFMEIASKGRRRLLTSRSFIDVYDVPENRYVYDAVCKVGVLIERLAKISDRLTSLYDNKCRDLDDRLNNFSEIVTIDKDLHQKQICASKKEIEDLNIKLLDSLKHQNKSKIDAHAVTFTVVLSQFFFDREDAEQWVAFKGKPKGTDGVWSEREEGVDFFVFKFPSELFSQIFKPNVAYEITAITKKNRARYWNASMKENKYYSCWYVFFIESSKVIQTQTSQYLEEKFLESEKIGWRRELKKDEKDQQEKEKSSILSIKAQAKKQIASHNELYLKLEPQIGKIESLKKSFANHGVRRNSSFPDSMTFIQNPNYQGIHKKYKEIIDSCGLDENLFLGLEEVEKIGILNISRIYERWCLLQVIKVLVNNYKYIPEEGWKEILVNKISNRKDIKNVSLNLKNTILNTEIKLWYEKELASGTRPDFILDFKSLEGEDKTHRLVMDAKFYENINDKHGGIGTVIRELYFPDKDYAESGKNAVFILHPSSNNPVPQKSTPQDWAGSSYYGEVQMFEWDEELRSSHNHEYGAVLLSPMVNKGSYLDDLQRLIGMFLQYIVEDNDDAKGNVLVKAPFCLVCGSTKIKLEDPPGNFSIWATCEECDHFAAFNYCGGCKTRLIKNGSYWTYHATMASEPFNIMCPSCTSFYIRRS